MRPIPHSNGSRRLTLDDLSLLFERLTGYFQRVLIFQLFLFVIFLKFAQIALGAVQEA